MTEPKKIYFTCPWQDSESLLFKYKKITPKQSGIWKNIEATTNYEEAEYLIIMDNVNDSILQKGEAHFLNKFSNLDKVIHFQRENESILGHINNWYMNNIFPKLKNYISPQNGFLYCFVSPTFIDKTYDELKNMPFPEKTKNISTIISYKHNPNINDGYNKRVNFIRKYSNKYKIDIFGKDWNKNLLGDNYKGELESYHNNSIKKTLSTNKSDGLLKYNYSIALENYPNDKVISEKFTDCILCWSIPIYWGNNTLVKQTFPMNSYNLINIENDNTFEDIQKIILNKPTKEEIKALKINRDIILDKLNIWEYIYQIINNSNIYNYKYMKLDIYKLLKFDVNIFEKYIPTIMRLNMLNNLKQYLKTYSDHHAASRHLESIYQPINVTKNIPNELLNIRDIYEINLIPIQFLLNMIEINKIQPSKTNILIWGCGLCTVDYYLDRLGFNITSHDNWSQLPKKITINFLNKYENNINIIDNVSVLEKMDFSIIIDTGNYLTNRNIIQNSKLKILFTWCVDRLDYNMSKDNLNYLNINFYKIELPSSIIFINKKNINNNEFIYN